MIHRVFSLVLLALTLWAQAHLEIHTDTKYLLKVPAGFDHWVFARDPNHAQWLYLSRENPKDLESPGGFSKCPRYTAGVIVTCERLTDDCAWVKDEKSGNSGWVVRELVEMIPEQRRAYQAQQIALAKQKAERQAREKARDAKEQAYIASLPRLWSDSTSGVLVATSMDCARDYEKILQFGRKHGTGVEFRKKLKELVTLGCAISMPSGTTIKVINRDAQFVEFHAYTGPNKGSYAVALKENVR